MNERALDFVERVGATFGFTFLSVFSFTDLSTWHDALIAGAAASATIVKEGLKTVAGK